ncbi:MAG: FAD-dependent oxidoreductase [Gemmatimonadales bacterium]
MSRIAIVGTGVSGLVAAHRLHREHDLTVFEADDRVGGHVHTWTVRSGGRDYQVDTGFIVCNELNYPNFLALLGELGVRTQPSTMSFSVRHDRARLEYNGSTIRQLFAQLLNAIRPAFYSMLADVLRFNRAAVRLVSERGDEPTLGAVIQEQGYSAAFRDWYLVPMGSAIWSLPPARVLEMPARFFVDFFRNHGMLTVNDRPTWRVVEGGSSRYVEALTAPFRDRIRLRHRVRRIARFPDRVEVDGERFDRVVLACHSDQALALLADPSPAERAVLGALPYQENEVVLHTDASVLPRKRAAWGAWNYRITADPEAPAVVTYYMNQLQSLDAPDPFCVTLNATGAIDPARIVGRVTYHHPVVTVAGVAARARRAEVSGANRTHYCGAYWGSGFHEDGVVSGLAVVGELEAALRHRAVA